MKISFDLGVCDGTSTKLSAAVTDGSNPYSIELWENGEFTDTHGPFPCAGDAVETLNAFLAKQGIRPLAEEEREQLFMRLLAARGGIDLARRVAALAGQESAAAERMAKEIASHVQVNRRGIVAIRIDDGTSDGRLYPDTHAALAAQVAPDRCTLLALPPWPRDLWTAAECAEHLAWEGDRINGRLPLRLALATIALQR